MSTTGTHKVRHLASSVEHPFLHRFDPQSIRVFLRAYDAYCREVYARASQLNQDASTSVEPVSPVSLLYCVDAEQLESAVQCGMIDGCTDVDRLTTEALRTFLDNESQESQSSITEADLAATVQATLKMDMTVKSARVRMKLLFMDYLSLLRTNGLKWVPEKNPKLAIRHVLSSCRPTQLRTRLEQDISFSHHHLKANFAGFMQHALDVSTAFEKVDNGPPKARKAEKDVDNNKSSANSTGASSSKVGNKVEPISKRNNKVKSTPPSPCPLPKCKGKNRLHWMSDCTDHTDAEKKQYRDDITAAKASDGPSRSTRSQTASATKSVNRVHKDNTQSDDSPSCRMTVSDVRTSLDVIGRCDDGSDENIANSELA